MAQADIQEVMSILRREYENGLPELDRETVKRVLTEPQQETLAEALAADLAVPGSLSPIVPLTIRWSKARERGINYGARPQWVDEKIAELPYPWNELADMTVNVSVIAYLDRKYDIGLPTDPQTVLEDAALDVERNVVEKVVNTLPEQ